MTPVKIRPRILKLPVNGHFLSTKLPSLACLGVLNPKPTARTFFLSLRRRHPSLGCMKQLAGVGKHAHVGPLQTTFYSCPFNLLDNRNRTQKWDESPCTLR